MKPRIVVVGSFNQDLTWNCTEFPAPGSTIVGRFTSGPGGKGSNQAVACARAGGATAFVAALGRDAFGREAARFLRAEGIATRIAEKKLPTGNAAILVNGAGQNQIVVALGANGALRPADVPAALLRGARVVVCQHEIALATNAAVLRSARRSGALTVLNPAPMRPDFDPAILAHVDVLIPNETEFDAITARLPAVAAVRRKLGAAARARRPSPAVLQALCRAVGVPTVILTLGSRGCFVSRPEGGQLLTAHAVRAIDTTGAGDAFVGALCAALAAKPGNFMAAARFANTAAAVSVTRRGAAPAMPRRAEILAQLRRASRVD
ncbi:MAG: ribokinase [Verrucomicrobia bacterium]|nr:ribokinase [Verrucomicrobiota bacterium]